MVNLPKHPGSTWWMALTSPNTASSESISRSTKWGFVWINLDCAKDPEVKWEELFDSVDTQRRLKAFHMKNYRYDHSWDMDGEYNWKTLIDNYNEVNCLTNFERPWSIDIGLLVLSLLSRTSWYC